MCLLFFSLFYQITFNGRNGRNNLTKWLHRIGSTYTQLHYLSHSYTDIKHCVDPRRRLLLIDAYIIIFLIEIFHFSFSVAFIYTSNEYGVTIFFRIGTKNAVIHRLMHILFYTFLLWINLLPIDIERNKLPEMIE